MRHALPPLTLLGALVGCSAPPTFPPGTDPSTDSETPADDPLPDRDSGEDPTIDPECEALHADLEDALADAYGSDSPGGIVAAVHTPTCGTWSTAFGEAEPGVALTTDRLARIGSVTKTYTAATTLRVAREGRLSLHDTLDQYVPEVPNAGTITIRQLLNHTSGVFDVIDDPEFMAALGSDPHHMWTPDEVLAVALKHEPNFAPGEGWSYSNTNYLLLGMILEQATELSATDVMRTRILDPLGLEDTYMETREPLPSEIARGYGPDGSDMTSFNASARWTGGSLVTTVEDLLGFVDGLMSSDVLESADLESMLDTSGTGGPQYGLGIMVKTSELGIDMFGHGGNVPGYNAVILHAPALEASVALITTQPAGGAAEIGTMLVDQLGGTTQRAAGSLEGRVDRSSAQLDAAIRGRRGEPLSPRIGHR